jgi:ABC-type phosphate transport system substrate-binding protein
MKRIYKLAVATVMAGGLLLSATGAGATPGPPAGYGGDGKADIVVGGGSDTTYRAMVGLTDLYNGAPGCTVNTTRGLDLNNCVYSNNAGDPADAASLGNYDHDTVAQANPTGSGAGVGSLNNFCNSCTVTYNGANGNVDFARSSSGPKTTGGAISGGNELSGDTFWGFAQDGLEVMTFENRGAQVQAAGGSAITPSELYHIYNCDYTKWSDVPSLNIALNSATDGPIVPWGMNSASGTYGTFNTYLIANGGAPANWTANGQSCIRFKGGYVSGGAAASTAPFENDIKQIFNAVPAANLAPTDYASKDNPNNWIWWGSFGELSAFSYKSNYQYPVGTGNVWNALDVPINGVRPSSSKILSNQYPIGRTLYHVTKNTDADCPGSTNPGDPCAFSANPGPTLPSGTGTDLNVVGATGGKGGAVREFTRWLCRSGSAAHAIDPYTGKNYASEIPTAINNAGFTVVPAGLRTAGSSCSVKS